MRLPDTARLCLLCHSPVETVGALHCSSLCRLVWNRLRRLQSAESCRSMPDDIPALLDQLEIRHPLQLEQWQLLAAWAGAGH